MGGQRRRWPGLLGDMISHSLKNRGLVKTNKSNVSIDLQEAKGPLHPAEQTTWGAEEMSGLSLSGVLGLASPS